MPNRQIALNNWLKQVLDSIEFSLIPLTGDASFRRYYRLSVKNIQYIVMDAPPDKESLHTFIKIANLFKKYDIHTPDILAADEALGFAVIEDFGDHLLLNTITPSNTDDLYHASLDTLIHIQQIPLKSNVEIPPFDTTHCMKELHIFTEWFLDKYLKLTLNSHEQDIICQSLDWITHEVVSQPNVVIHRDYHSRNIMVLSPPHQSLGIIDFQDAMIGSITYDLVSLLKDCYIQWPKEQIFDWLRYYYERSPQCKNWSFSEFTRAFDLCGLQRHLKVLGIFSRLYLRDNKPGYLKDLPLTLHYVLDCLESYEELRPFYNLMQQKVKLP